MKKQNPSELHITGIGVTSSIGQGKEAFASSLIQGRHAFRVMQRSGRQKGTSFIGAEIPSLSYSDKISKKLLRTASLSGHVALTTLDEAWNDAQLDEIDPRRIGLVIGGSNFQQRELLLTYETSVDRTPYIRPTYGLSFMDSDLCGLCTEQFGISGFAYTVGGASASGQLAIIQAVQAVLSGQVDVCIAMGALMDLSYLELQSLRSLGAMGSDRYANEPALACRPFDQHRDGFIYGESCGVVVIERAGLMDKRKFNPYASIGGWSVAMDANRNPNPSYKGEVTVIQEVLACAGLAATDIDYINPHGTGSGVGDETELKALEDCGLSHAYINATKSIIGHGLSSAGTVEVIATLLQMKEKQLHPSRNLENPINSSFNWVLGQAASHTIRHAVTLSMGFGGINTALCLHNLSNS